MVPRPGPRPAQAPVRRSHGRTHTCGESIDPFCKHRHSPWEVFLRGQPDAPGQDRVGFGWVGHCEGSQAGLGTGLDEPGVWQAAPELSGPELPRASGSRGYERERSHARVNMRVTCACAYKCVQPCACVLACVLHGASYGSVPAECNGRPRSPAGCGLLGVCKAELRVLGRVSPRSLLPSSARRAGGGSAVTSDFPAPS